MVQTHFSVVEAALPPSKFSPKDTTEENLKKISTEFVSKFSHAVEKADAEEFDSLFVDNGYWRDVVAFTNDYRAIAKPNILQAAKDRLSITGAHDAKVDFEPKFHSLDDYAYVEFGIRFATELGPSIGNVRLVKKEDGTFGAHLLYTALDGIHGHPERVRLDRIEGDKNSMLHYDEIRRRDMEDPNPSVLVVGAGHNGLAAAARLKYLGVRVLVVDRFERVGDNWRKRYGSLAVHDPLFNQQLPYMPWPENFPVFPSAGKMANWLESYAEAMELNVWTKTSVIPDETSFDEASQKWHVTVLRDGVRHKFEVSHLVMATGISGGKAKMPAPFPGQENFRPNIIHSAWHSGGAEWKGKKVLVVGTGSSGHDISLDLVKYGADVTMLQRSPTFIMSIKNGIVKTFNGDLLVEGVNLDYSDRITEGLPKAIIKATHQRLVPKILEMDKDLIDGLNKAGFRTYSGPDGSGFLFLSLERGGGFYYNSGASDRIVSGDIKIKNGEIDHFTEDSVFFKDGSELAPDLVIFCTGFTGFKESAEETLGLKYAAQLKKVWGLDAEGELQSLFRDCGIPNTYFASGAFPLARPNSRFLALQILAQQLGKFGDRYTIEEQKKSGSYVDLGSSVYQ